MQEQGRVFFLLKQRCIIYRRWCRQAASDRTEQRRRAAPFSFVGLFPVGRLCAGWMAAFEETRAAIELKVKAQQLQHYNVCHCRGQRGKEKGEERVTEDGGIVGVFDFGREERKKERVFAMREEKARKRYKE